MPDLPVGTVTFLFTDIVGSTRLLQEIGESYQAVLEDHNLILRSAIDQADGVAIRTEGDSFFAVFREAPDAVHAAVNAQRGLAAHEFPGGVDLKVRMGLHSGVGTAGGDDYVGIDVHRAARIGAAGHGNQVLLSAATLALTEHSLPDGVGVRDLGDHSLKDLAKSERIYRLVMDGVPENTAAPASMNLQQVHLPETLDSFVGRTIEMETASKLLDRTRLLTLTGPGGTGKTRLALELAGSLVGEFRDGVRFVPLAGISDHGQVATKVLESFPEHLADATISVDEDLEGYLAGRNLLLVLDNFEHVVDAAPLVARILTASPGIKVLVTSRVSLQIAGEQEMLVPPLPVPDSDAHDADQGAAGYDAIALFAERARAVRPAFELDADNLAAVAELVAKLDGLPLAIELAASRIRTLPPATVLDNLSHVLSSGSRRNLPPRQQTMRNTIAWSFDLLTDPAKELLALLSVFAGGAGLSEIEAVAEPQIGNDLLVALEVLVEHSLIRSEESDGAPRFHTLETVRQFGLDELVAMGSLEAAQERHARTYAAIVATAEPHLTGSGGGRWLDILSVEHDNIRLAQQWAIDNGEIDVAYGMASSLWRFFHMRGLLAPARSLLRDLLARSGASVSSRAKALEAAGGVAYWSGDMDEAYDLYSEALVLRRQIGQPRDIAYGIYNLAFARNYGSGGGQANDLFEEALEMFVELDDRPGMAAATWGLGDAWAVSGDLDKARDCFEVSIAEFEQLDDSFGLGWALYTQGEILLQLGEHDKSREHLERGLALLDSRDLSAIVMFLAAFAALEMASGNRERGVRLAGAMTGLREATGTDLVRVGFGSAPDVDSEAMGMLEGDLAAVFEEGRSTSAADAIEFALAGGP